ncbi:hypothetical protein ACFOSC_27790 [Streptantibioticus rubrisoli]|uniref:Aminoglycoside phosphotransferase domain-containing protein n=1 Tax=Streptantibioticus rubrisoli TaxID=1387313 RepID=A0ABT1PK91_9ACTN|nr:hypothetical protein [Streptantibioticus rubrisoli]MCQ4045784.1 hypothetical protein [Streptantibioticus rubrisoli]
MSHRTAPVGPLDGAARLRPDGWLDTPLTTSIAHAEAQARALLPRHHPAAPGPVRCLTARYRTATFTLGDPPQQLLKRHAAEAAYLGEVLAYQLLQHEAALPALHGCSDTALTLVVDYLDQPAPLDGPKAWEDLVATVAAVHTAPTRWPAHTADAMSQWRLDQLLEASTPAWIRDPPAWRLLLQLTADAHGTGHVPLGHLDLKPDHCRRDNGHLVLIDAETLRPDLTGLPDLITLAYLARDHPDMPPGWIRQVYRQHCNQLGATWTDASLVRALEAFAQATGLHSLHGATT